jgi:hypothetical protein
MTHNWRAEGMPKQRRFLATRPKPVLTVDSAFAPSTNPPTAFSACLAVSPTQALQGSHQWVNIPQWEHGGNGESTGVAKVGKPILAPQEVEIPINALAPLWLFST